jgi:hypothetical protein
MEIIINVPKNLMTLIDAYSEMMNIDKPTAIIQLCQIGAEEVGVEYKIEKQR